MQNITWYYHRLRTMAPAEILWRGKSRCRDILEGYLAAYRPRAVRLKPAAENWSRAVTGAGQIGPDLRFLREPATVVGELESWKRELLARADRIAAGRLTVFDRDFDLSEGADWNYECKAGKNTPRGFSAEIDYRDYAVTGDCKFVWEPNRHQHWVVLARAFRLTGDERYTSAIISQMESWIAQCPFGMGMNWRSPLELGVRLINWVWTLELLGESALPTALRDRLAAAAGRHLWEISRKYSRFSSANNHRIGEAAGVFIGSSYFGGLHGSERYRCESRRILAEEIREQTYPDGASREQAMGYHLFVLEFFLLAGLVARRGGEDFPAAYWARLEKMLEFLAAMQEGGEHLPIFGDCDDGYVLDLGNRRDRGRDLLALGGILLKRRDLLSLAGGYREPAMWLLGERGWEDYYEISGACRGVERETARMPLASRCFPDSGVYLLQHGAGGEATSVTFDCGELGFGPVAAHGHADALSVTLRMSGTDVLVDPGTYDYFTYRPWRDYFRSTRAHNTVVVDGRNQSETKGLFLWGRRAEARLLSWEPSTDGGLVSGEHNGYAELGVSHRRSVQLSGRKGELEICDVLEGAGRHDAEFFLHFGEDCLVEPLGGSQFSVRCGKSMATLSVDPQLEIELARGREAAILGWISRAYHRKQPVTTLVGRCRWEKRLETILRVDLCGATRGVVPAACGGMERSEALGGAAARNQ